ncbi:MAG TPA: hypothetical protein VM487_09255 [Phycisphaerae bacterium]|nr:hypothetical protein [Phycisphaerae bacterium]
METPTENLAGVVDETGTVCTDRTCLKCGYNLRGLQQAGRCPECGTPVGLSIHGDLLCYAEPGYVNKLARGSRWIMRGLTIGVLCFVLFFVSGFVLVFSAMVGSFLGLPVGAWLTVLGLGMLAAAIMVLVGVWFLTTPQPGVFQTDKRDTARRLVRICILVSFLGMALGMMVESLAPPPPVMAAFEILLLGFSVLGVVAVTAYFLYLRDLALRISPDSASSGKNDPRGAKSLAVWFAVVLGVLVLLYAVDTVLLWGPVLTPSLGPPVVYPATSPAALPGEAWRMFKSCAGGIAGIAILVLFLIAVRLHHRLRKAFAQQATLAAQHWGQAPVPVATPIDDPAPP